jgi:NADH-quinone oxidoreductase subunit L
LGVAISCALSIYVSEAAVFGACRLQRPVYTWLISDGVHMDVGFLIDRLSA